MSIVSLRQAGAGSGALVTTQGLVVAAWFAALVELIKAISPIAAVLTLPIAVWEFSLGVYLTSWGFRPCPITEGS